MALNPTIIQAFKNSFKENCVDLLLDGYSKLSLEKDLTELSENNITARLVGYIKSSSKRNLMQISVNREAYHDTEDTYSGEIDADESARIDIKCTTWNSNCEFDYYIECKNLAENNWVKSNEANVDASKLRRRYISTGIQNFTTGRYPLGCLVGYVLQGNAIEIAKKINALLESDSRGLEILKPHPNKHCPFYRSNHVNTCCEELEHYLFVLN